MRHRGKDGPSQGDLHPSGTPSAEDTLDHPTKPHLWLPAHLFLVSQLFLQSAGLGISTQLLSALLASSAHQRRSQPWSATSQHQGEQQPPS